MQSQGTLIFFCGKMGAGKSTRSRQLAQELNAILISEDEWLSQLYPQEIQGIADYIHYSRRLKGLLKQHLVALLKAGLSVVMDFPANTKTQRAWFQDLIREQGIAYRFIYLDVDDQTCLARIAQRRQAEPDRAPFDTEAMFHEVTRLFEPPTADEGWDVEVIHPSPATQAPNG